MTKIDNHASILADFIDGQSVAALAEQYGVHVTTIYRSLHKYGVQTLKVSGGLDERNELICGEYIAGCKVVDIAKRYHLSSPAIYAIIRNYKNSCT